jgi:NTE family protein
MKLLFYRILFIALVCSLGWRNVNGGERPRIGLVLSGGGARGMAHIGVLKVMEEAGIMPDYITGTSMGSIVGGLYALGYTAEELEKIVQAINWDDVLTNQVALDEVTIEEKGYYGRYIAELPIDGLRVGLPRGLIEGQKLTMLLSRLTRSAHGIEDFSKLPIPFACVGTDIETGEPVVLNRGSLPEAIRASMAIPTVFTPVELDGRLLVDGGLVRNFPVEEVLAMGADIVIGVFVSEDLLPKEKLTSMVSVLMQSAFVHSVFDTRAQRQLVDLYIEPNLSPYTTFSFNQSQAIIDSGASMAADYRDALLALADSVYRTGPGKVPPPVIDKNEFLISRIRVEGNESIGDQFIAGRIGLDSTGMISLVEIEEAISLIYGIRHFNKVAYQLLPDSDSTELVIRVEEAASGHLNLAAHYDSENLVGINASLIYRNLLLKGSRILLEADIAPKPRWDLNYLKYLGFRQNTAGVLGVNYKRLSLPVVDNGAVLANYKTDYWQPYLQWQSTSRRNWTIGVRLFAEVSTLTPEIADLDARNIDEIWNRSSGVRIFFLKNTLDRPFFPNRGSRMDISFKYLFEVNNKIQIFLPDSAGGRQITPVQQYLDPFGALEFEYQNVWPLRRKLVLLSDARFAITSLNATGLNITDYYFAGGFNPRFVNSLPLAGALEKAYFLPNYLLIRLGFRYEPFNRTFLTLGFDYADAEVPAVWFYPDAETGTMDGLSRRAGASLSAGFLSPVGPLSISLAKDFHGNRMLANLNLGFYF